ncbi:MAG: glycosyltransferase family 2 protein [Acidobacteriaceae bacterium]
MQNKQPLLTIAIPTYNRSKYLAELLKTLAPQLAGEQRVELIISDNASTDDTVSLVKRFQDEGLSARYIRNDTNLGPDGNFLQCFNEAQGKYFWIFGDDDAIDGQGVSKTLALLELDEYDIVYLCPYFFGDNRIRRSQSNRHTRSPQVFSDPKQFASKVNVFFTFITGNIVNKDRISSVPHDPFGELVGSNLIQLGWTYTALRYHRKSLYIHERLIGCRSGNTGGYGIFRVFGENLMTITDRWLATPQLARVIKNGVLLTFMPHALFLTQYNNSTFEKEDPHKILGPIYGDSYYYWIFNYPLMVLPRWGAKFWLLCIKVLNRLNIAFRRWGFNS